MNKPNLIKKPKIGSYWTHKKTRNEYKVVHIGLWEETLEECVVYVSLRDFLLSTCWE